MDNIRNELERLRNDVWHILQMDYNKRADFIPAILGGIDGILEIPKRNCEVGTAEEQTERFKDLCRKYRRGPGPRANCKGCPIQHESSHVGCTFAWSQMPYEKGATK